MASDEPKPSAEAPHEKKRRAEIEERAASLNVVYPGDHHEEEPVRAAETPTPAAPSEDLEPLAAEARNPAGSDAPIESDVAEFLSKEPTRVPVSRVEANPHQPRRDFDEAELQQLAESLRTHGLLQPIVVRKYNDVYQLIAGERRLRAAIMAGWSDVPVQVVEADDRHMAELAIVENLQRKDLNPLEKAMSFRDYLEEYTCTQEELALRLQINRSTVANLIRLLDLPSDVQDAVRADKLTQGHARALLPLGDADDMCNFCERIIEEQWSVRQTETNVGAFLRGEDLDVPTSSPFPPAGSTKGAQAKSPQIRKLEQEFKMALGSRCTLKANDAGKGKLTIHFKNHDDFERLHALLCGEEEMREAG